MRGSILFVITLCIALSITGCAQYDRVAIEKSKQYPSSEAQVKYLVGEANTLLGMEKYDAAINVSEYILENLDPNSGEARDIIKMAKAGIEEAELYQLIQPHYYFGDKSGVWKHEWWEIGPPWDSW